MVKITQVHIKGVNMVLTLKDKVYYFKKCCFSK